MREEYCIHFHSSKTYRKRNGMKSKTQRYDERRVKEQMDFYKKGGR